MTGYGDPQNSQSGRSTGYRQTVANPRICQYDDRTAGRTAVNIGNPGGVGNCDRILAFAIGNNAVDSRGSTVQIQCRCIIYLVNRNIDRAETDIQPVTDLICKAVITGKISIWRVRNHVAKYGRRAVGRICCNAVKYQRIWTIYVEVIIEHRQQRIRYIFINGIIISLRLRQIINSGHISQGNCSVTLQLKAVCRCNRYCSDRGRVGGV